MGTGIPANRIPAKSCSDPLRHYFIALGSNVGDRLTTLRGGWQRLAAMCELPRLSGIYETRPQYVTDQPLYLNAVGEVTSRLEPEDLLAELHRIEADFGRNRVREIRMGPRTLDLDILLADSLLMDSPSLTIPHPRLSERLFVLVPLLELAADLKDPKTGQPYAHALKALQDSPGTGDGSIRPYEALPG
jgi:2-amino-4-hydroxy-6-hydroxymethyldihydropteridine diphosphokinase